MAACVPEPARPLSTSPSHIGSSSNPARLTRKRSASACGRSSIVLNPVSYVLILAGGGVGSPGPYLVGTAIPPSLVVPSNPLNPAKTRRLGADCNYPEELRRLQIELVKMQEWVRHERLKVTVIFEGRDAAGKGGAIKRIAECLNPRVCRIA